MTLILASPFTLSASETKAKGLSSFIINEMQTLQDLFLDQDWSSDKTDGDFKLYSYSVRVKGKVGIELPKVARLRFQPSIEVTFKPAYN